MNEKCILSILRGVFSRRYLQSAYIPSFNARGSTYAFNLQGAFLNYQYNNLGMNDFLRFGEKQDFDSFILPTKDFLFKFPYTYKNVISGGANVQILNKRNYNSFYFLILMFLSSMPNIYFGNEYNTGGTVENNQLIGKTTLEVPKNQNDVVFAVNEGDNITSGFYNNASSSIVNNVSMDVWKDESMLSDIISTWKNKLHMLEKISIIDDPFIIPLNDGQKGWISFWLDLQKANTIFVENDIDDFESYPVPDNVYGNVSPSNCLWVELSFPHYGYAVATSTLTTVNVAGNNKMQWFCQDNNALSCHYGVRIPKSWDVTTTGWLSFEITFNDQRSTTWPTLFGSKSTITYIDDLMELSQILSSGGLGSHVVNGRSPIPFGGLIPIVTLLDGVTYNIKYQFYGTSIIGGFTYIMYDLIVDDVVYDNGGLHFGSGGSVNIDNLVEYFGFITSPDGDNGFNQDVDIYFDDFKCSWLENKFELASIDIGESRLFIADSFSTFYINGDTLYDYYDREYYKEVDWTKPHRLTFYWDFTNQSNPITYIQLDMHDPKYNLLFNNAGAGLVNGMSYNALRISSELIPLRIYGIVQSGDWFPWVFPEINRQYFTPWNYNAMEHLDLIGNASRRDSEGFKNLYATQDFFDSFQNCNAGNVDGQEGWIADATDTHDGVTVYHFIIEPLIGESPYTDEKYLELYDSVNPGICNIYKNFTMSSNGKITMRIVPITGGAAEYYYIGLYEGAVLRIQFRYDNATGVFSIQDRAAAWNNVGTLTLDAENTIEIEWDNADRNGDAITQECRIGVNGAISAWINTLSAFGVGVDNIHFYSANATVSGGLLILNVSIDLVKDFIAGYEPSLSYPDGNWLGVNFIQRGRFIDEGSKVKLYDNNNNGISSVLSNISDENTIEDHRVDEIVSGMESNESNYRYLPPAGLQWVNGDVANGWLPVSFVHQRHPKYNFINIASYFHERYQFCYSELNLPMNNFQKMISGNLGFENVADLEYLPLKHSFIHPNNIGFYLPSFEAMPEKFLSCPQRLRKEVRSVVETFGWGNDGDNVAVSADWTVAPAAGCSATIEDFRGTNELHVVDANAAASFSFFYTFPLLSQTIPGYYSVEFDITPVAVSQLDIDLVDGVANAGFRFSCASTGFFTVTSFGPVITNLIPYEIFRRYHVKMVATSASTFHVFIDGVQFTSAGADWTNVVNFAAVLTLLSFGTSVAATTNVYIDNVEINWKIVPHIHEDDSIVLPSHLGHARPLEITCLNDRYGFLDYGKYTVVSNEHPTKFWSSFYLSSIHGSSENMGEIVYYDRAGNEMFYLKVAPLRNSDLSNRVKVLIYASDSAETTTALTTIDGSWEGWLPVSIEIDADNAVANVYFHDKHVAGPIAINAGLTGLHSIVFMGSYMMLPAGMAGVFFTEDFQLYGQGVDIEAAAVPWLWTRNVAAGGIASFTGHWINGDAWGKYVDADLVDWEELTYTFSAPSPGIPGVYAVKQNMIIDASGCEVILSAVAGTFNTHLYLGRTGEGVVEYDNGGGPVALTTNAFVFRKKFELIIVTMSNTRFYIVIDGVIYDNAGAGYLNQAAYAAAIACLEYVSSYATAVTFYVNNIEASWLCMDMAGLGLQASGSLLVDGIQISPMQDDRKTARVYEKKSFLLPYRDYTNYHSSTFANGRNGPLPSELIPLPPIYDVPVVGYNQATWVTGDFWNFYSKQNDGMYGGIVANWYAWRFTYIFGGNTFDIPDLVSGIDLSPRSCQRLQHTSVNNGYGSWELPMGAVVEDTDVENFKRFDDGDVVLDSFWTLNVLSGTVTVRDSPNKYLIGKWLEFENTLLIGGGALATFTLEKNVTWFGIGRRLSCEFEFYMDSAFARMYIKIFMSDGTNQEIQIDCPAGNLIQYRNNMGVIVPSGLTFSIGHRYKCVIELVSSTQYTIYICDENGTARNVTVTGPAIGTAFSNIEFGGWFGGNGKSYINNIKFSGLEKETAGQIVVTCDLDDLSNVDYYPLNLNNWALRFIEGNKGTELWVNDDANIVSFSEFADGYVIPAALPWTIAHVGAVTSNVKDDNGNKVLELIDTDPAGRLDITYTFSSTNLEYPVCVSYRIKLITNMISASEFRINSSVGNMIAMFSPGFGSSHSISFSNGAVFVYSGDDFTFDEWHKIQFLFVNRNEYYGIFDNKIYGPYTRGNTSYIATIQFLTANLNNVFDCYVDDFAASWLGNRRKILELNDGKELHDYKIESVKGNIRTYIDNSLVDESMNNGGNDFDANKLKIHVAPSGIRGNLYAIVHGAQYSLESEYKSGALSLIPGGTMEPEGVSGEIITKNEGSVGLGNNDWSFEKMHYWKRIIIDDVSLKPTIMHCREIKDFMIEFGLSGANEYTYEKENYGNSNITHSGKAGATNVDLQEYGKFFSLYMNDFTFGKNAARMNLFDVYTFTNRFFQDNFSFDILGIEGSIARLFTPFAIELSEIQDTMRRIHNEVLIENKSTYNIRNSLDSYNLSLPRDFDTEKLRVLLGLLERYDYSSVDNLKEWLSILYGTDKSDVRLSESNDGFVNIVVPFPQPSGIFGQIPWISYLDEFLDKFRAAGIKYEFTDVCTIKSENTSVKWNELTSQVDIT